MFLNHSRFLGWELLWTLFNRFIGSLESNFLSSLYILDIGPLLDVGLVKIFSQSVGCWVFPLLIVSFALQKLFNFMRFHLSIVYLRARAIGVLFRKFSPVSMSSRFFPTFSPISFSVSGFMWRSLIHLNLSFVQGDKNGSICTFLETCWPPVEPAPFVKHAVFFSSGWL